MKSNLLVDEGRQAGREESLCKLTAIKQRFVIVMMHQTDDSVLVLLSYCIQGENINDDKLRETNAECVCLYELGDSWH